MSIRTVLFHSFLVDASFLQIISFKPIFGAIELFTSQSAFSRKARSQAESHLERKIIPKVSLHAKVSPPSVFLYIGIVCEPRVIAFCLGISAGFTHNANLPMPEDQHSPSFLKVFLNVLYVSNEKCVTTGYTCAQVTRIVIVQSSRCGMMIYLDHLVDIGSKFVGAQVLSHFKFLQLFRLAASSKLA